ncbi:unnamed protein product [Rotaria magnacalcarata]|uniref:Uncharacterized protein n=1 Tax=Rotaria magnacalcarata TaxID=392030 RepID=A0A816DZR6_9BILA|nr:unnamed protein product [Rotaria magnacalcarata]CAF1640332.1 unnamed protein product [Rotaria magnacalcarata]CAF2074949.1 unnamed protein product [Rotaria magnacalcarata]CAF2133394.1 unnamed protein product [Rotaria magnacalcarata]CAF3962869.1 unnamed protein product [Rotaria magnacalcarata]
MGNGILRKSPNAVQPMGLQTKVRDTIEIKAAKIPDGRCNLYAGAHTDSNGNTCPILAIYTWHKTSQNVTQEEGQLDRLGGPPGGSLQRGQSTLLRDFSETKEFKVGVDQNIQMLAIEDILSIKVSTEVKKEAVQRTNAVLKEKPPEELTGCEKVKSCCTKTICRCCHEEVPDMPEYNKTTTLKTRANRVIMISIEYVRYGNVDTPSHIRVLSKEKQADFYHKLLHTETIKFYYLQSMNYDEDQFRKYLSDSETLARIVVQLKSMVGHYPDGTQLKTILEQKNVHAFGEGVSEEIQMLQGTGTTSTQIVQRSSGQN